MGIDMRELTCVDLWQPKNFRPSGIYSFDVTLATETQFWAEYYQ